MRTQSIPTRGIDRTSAAFSPRTRPAASRQVDTETGAMDTKSTPTHRDERLLTDPEACDYLRIGSRQLLSWRRCGWIPFIHIGYAVRYRKRDLDAALDALTVGSFAGATQMPVANAKHSSDETPAPNTKPVPQS